MPLAHAGVGRTAPDAARLPLAGRAPLVRPPKEAAPRTVPPHPGLGTAGVLARPFAPDPRPRPAPAPVLPDFGHTLAPGESFRFDVTFAGNPAGLARASVVEVLPDPRGGPPRGAPLLRLTGSARTSGVVSLLASVTDDIESLLDARSGFPVRTVNVIHYEGLRMSYRERVTTTSFHGRGRVHLDDRKDDRSRTRVRDVPIDTLDPLSAMAWVRSLHLQPGQRAQAHVMDGTALLRVEILARGRRAPDPMPPIAGTLELGPGDVEMIEGVLTRVDAQDRPIPGKPRYELRAYLSADSRHLPLRMETDMWVGAMRLDLVQYDPPTQGPPAAAGPPPAPGAP